MVKTLPTFAVVESQCGTLHQLMKHDFKRMPQIYPVHNFWNVQCTKMRILKHLWSVQSYPWCLKSCSASMCPWLNWNHDGTCGFPGEAWPKCFRMTPPLTFALILLGFNSRKTKLHELHVSFMSGSVRSVALLWPRAASGGAKLPSLEATKGHWMINLEKQHQTRTNKVSNWQSLKLTKSFCFLDSVLFLEILKTQNLKVVGTWMPQLRVWGSLMDRCSACRTQLESCTVEPGLKIAWCDVVRVPAVGPSSHQFTWKTMVFHLQLMVFQGPTLKVGGVASSHAFSTQSDLQRGAFYRPSSCYCSV